MVDPGSSQVVTLPPTLALLGRDGTVTGPAGTLHVRTVAPRTPRPQARPPIVLLHGAWHSAAAWELWQAYLGVLGWTTHAMSLRRHGLSAPVPDDVFVGLSPEDYVADLAAVLAWIGEPTVVIGHSLGGTIAQKAAETIAMRGLVLLASGSPAALPASRPADLPAGQPLVLERAAARAAFFHDADPAVVEAVLDSLGPESPGVLNQTGRAKVTVDPAAVRRNIGAAILVVGAEHDANVHPASRLAAFYGCPSATISGAGHDLMVERRGLDAADAIAAWLNQATLSMS